MSDETHVVEERDRPTCATDDRVGTRYHFLGPAPISQLNRLSFLVWLNCTFKVALLRRARSLEHGQILILPFLRFTVIIHPVTLLISDTVVRQSSTLFIIIQLIRYRFPS